MKSLEEAESEIAEDPHHTHWRRDTTDGAVLEYFAAGAGLIVKFRVVSPAVVDLEEVIDLERLIGRGEAEAMALRPIIDGYAIDSRSVGQM